MSPYRTDFTPDCVEQELEEACTARRDQMNYRSSRQRVAPSRRRKSSSNFNGIHRRRRKKFTW